MRTIKKIACVGEVMIELQLGNAPLASVGVAGDTFNTAVYMRRLLESKFSIDYVTSIGSDVISNLVFDSISAAKLGTAMVERHPDRSIGLYAISTDDQGERSFAYWRSDSAARTLLSETSQIQFEQLFEYDLIFISGISMAIIPSHVRSAWLQFAEKFSAAGGLIAYDSNHRSVLWESPETARAFNQAMWKRADIALPSLDDEKSLFNDTDERATIDRLLSYGISTGALKRGSSGPLGLDGTLRSIEHTPITSIVDSTAAGDSFNAGYLSAIAEGYDIVAAMEKGHCLAGKVIQHKGAIID